MLDLLVLQLNHPLHPLPHPLPKMLNQNQTPLLDTLKACAEHPHAPFYTPGHKRGQGISQSLADLFGSLCFAPI